MNTETITVDTYEKPMAVTSDDALAAFRGLEESRPKMSDAAKAKLRSLNEHDRANTQTDARMVTEFNSRPWTLEQMVNLFAKAFGGCTMNPRRRAVKAMFRLNKGLRVYHIHDLSFFGELLRGEDEMPMHRFLAKYPLPEDEMVTPKGEPEKPVKPVRLCKAGKKCMKFEKRRPAPVKGSGEYCSTMCSASARARAKRGLAALPANRLSIERLSDPHKQRLPEGFIPKRADIG
jgi:hypothetical protein